MMYSLLFAKGALASTCPSFLRIWQLCLVWQQHYALRRLWDQVKKRAQFQITLSQAIGNKAEGHVTVMIALRRFMIGRLSLLYCQQAEASCKANLMKH
ncbi:uncharacterized protein PHALS_01805 [Plasmopara halstedii]|uniref:Uncharacterized protein n=1 Tax=Plasmopara halstedii TaxID=4781 RepID=A0A0P1AVY6_PLAHL|nr:uncharacterized protein PHALS_01805 [Plasmopara halstedii]CEG45514.1 hypothetical protein PHALS_01805 [Plasmopara halstedii]|eukprot:XP_024581883.1 hypothetical protein PHALS_01805 [Plasmopara halstedii]